MAEENKIILDADVKPLKKQLREATQELQLARQRYGEFSDEAVRAAQNVAGIRDSIEAANEQAQLFDPGKRFQALTNAASTAAGAIGAVQGAMALFGDESEDVEKALLKVQSAMALSQGLSQLKDIGKVGDELRTSFIGLTGGVNNFKKALITTGIGALVVAVGLIVAYWEDIKDLVSGTSARIQKQNDLLNEQIASNDENLSLLESSKQLAVLRGESEVVINAEIEKQLMLQQETYKQLIASLELQLETEKTQARQVTYWEQIKIGLASTLGLYAQAYATAEAYNDTTDKSLELEEKLKEAKEKSLSVDIKLATQQKEEQDKANKASEEAKKRKEEEMQAEAILQDARVKMFDKQKQEEYAIEQAYSEKFKQLKKAGVKDDGSLEAAKQKELKEIRDKYLNEQLQEEETFQKIINDLRTKSRLEGIEDENTKAREALLIEQEKRRKELLAGVKDNAERKKILEMELAQSEKQELDSLEKSFAEAKLISDLAELDAEAAKITTTYERQREIIAEQEAINLELYGKTEDQRTAILEASAEQRKAIDMAELTAKTDMQNKYFDLAAQFGNVMQQFAGKNKKLAIAGVIVEQSAAIGSIISNTAAANAKAVSATPLTGGLPFTAINTLSAGLSIASTIRGAVKAIQGINSANSVNSGGGIQAPAGISASAPSTASAVPTIGTSPVTALGTMMANQPPLKAYVVESEVTSTQRRVADIERRAGF